VLAACSETSSSHLTHIWRKKDGISDKREGMQQRKGKEENSTRK